MIIVIICSAIASIVLIATAMLTSYSPFMVAAIPLLILILYFFARYPQVLAILLVCSTVFDSLIRMPGQSESFTLFKILFPLALLILILRYFLQADKPIPFQGTDIWLLIWIIYNAALILFAVSKSVAVKTYLRNMNMWLYYFVISRLFTDPVWRKRLLIASMVAVGVSVALGAINVMSGDNPFYTNSDDFDNRLTGATGVSPNDYATFLFLPFFFTVFNAVESTGKKKLLYLAFTLLLAAGIVFTQSRSAFITIGVCLLFVLFHFRKKIKIQNIFAVVVVLAIAVPFVPKDNWDRIFSIFSESKVKEDTSLIGRANFIAVGLNILKDFPLLGCGPGNFPVLHAMAKYQTIPYLINVEFKPHNMYLEVITETGIIGSIIWIGLLLSLILTFRGRPQPEMPPEAKRNRNVFLLTLMSFLIMGLFLHLSVNKFFWLLLAFIRTLQEETVTWEKQ